jgi:hypothetical protein
MAPEYLKQARNPIALDQIGFAIDNYSTGLVVAEILGFENFNIDKTSAPYRNCTSPIKFKNPPAKNEPGYLVWRLIQENPLQRASLDEALSLCEQIDWSISKKYA